MIYAVAIILIVAAIILAIRFIDKRNGAGAIITILVGFCMLSMLAKCSYSDKSQQKPHSTRESTYSSTYAPQSSSRPACPPVNRTPAMTADEAEALKGTGYHGCRPNSSAESTELKAAQAKCAECGYHTDNGTNSLCDYCQWQYLYGTDD